jgi:hypothetical protein
MNIAELFNQKSFAKKVISIDELALHLQQISDGRLNVQDKKIKDLPDFTMTKRRMNALIARSDKETYSWIGDPLRVDRVPCGSTFKTGKAIGYDILIDIANGFDVDPQVIYTAFEACADHAPKLEAGQLKPKFSKK